MAGDGHGPQPLKTDYFVGHFLRAACFLLLGALGTYAVLSLPADRDSFRLGGLVVAVFGFLLGVAFIAVGWKSRRKERRAPPGPNPMEDPFR